MKSRPFGSFNWLFAKIFRHFAIHECAVLRSPPARRSALRLLHRLVEGSRRVDAVYFFVATIAALGYGVFSPQTDIGKVFTIFYILTGIFVLVADEAALTETLLRRALLNDHDKKP